MKEVIAILRPGKDRITKAALAKIGCLTHTTFRVFGRGKQRGLAYRAASTDGTVQTPVVGMRYLPKKMICLIVNDHQLKPVVQTIIRVNKTEQHGDGRIFVMDVGEVIRVRTGEKNQVAIR